MIYLFDEKKSRQLAYNWTDEKFELYSKFIVPVYQYSDVQDLSMRKVIFSETNTILFHESFFDADFNKHEKEALKIRRDLEDFAAQNPNFWVAFFSGSKNARVLVNNVAYLPVATLYQNLEEFIRNSAEGNYDLRHLLYGKNPNVERELFEKLNTANNEFDTNVLIKHKAHENILVARTTSNYLPNIIKEVDYKVLINDDDAYLHEKTIEWLQEKQYSKIFIPICFGSSLSDFNGLRFASHIRCTNTVNQGSPIYIYSFVDYWQLVSHECFDILKTRNVTIVPYNVSAFEEAIISSAEPLKLADLQKEVAKVALKVPDNYEDSHSIVNEWAIYRWARAIHAKSMGIETIVKKIASSLYFKYLNTIYPGSEMPIINPDDLKLRSLEKPKILFVDDDAEKGWYEIICLLLSDINGVDSVDYFGDDLKKISKNVIVEKVVKKIQDDDIDLVILDFRLHSDDFVANDIKHVTGFKLLNEIKEINYGIQVVIFSATNKVWNLISLQKAGADGFIIKESPQNSVNPDFTQQTLAEFIKTIDKCMAKGFVKKIFDFLLTIQTRLTRVEDVLENAHFTNFIKTLRAQLKVIFSTATNIDVDKPITLDVVFVSCYTFLDLFKKYYLTEGNDHRYYLGFREEELIRYNVLDGSIINEGSFVPRNYTDKPGVFHVYSSLIKNYYSLPDNYDSTAFIRKIFEIRNVRNDYIHGTKRQIKKEELLSIVECLLPITHSICE